MEPLSNVIGEGTYGCVHKPSLKCKQKKINYTNKISKTMTTEDAISELKEYKAISKIDSNNNFYLGKPIKCILDKTPSNIGSIRKCSKNKNFLNEIDKLSLLIMEDGGENLEDFANKLSSLPVTEENKKEVELFWIEAHRIIYGLSIFLKNGIVHHDLKPQNIVYNSKTNRLNFIDFGLMKKKKNIINLCKNSQYRMALFHWSFPFEIEILNKKVFSQFTTMQEKDKINYFNNLMKAITNNSKNEKIRHIKTFFSFITKNNLTNEEHEKYIKFYLTDYFNMMTYNLQPNMYNEFLEKSVSTIDIFGAGIAFFYVLINSLQFLDDYLRTEFSFLFYSMVNLDVYDRITTDSLLSKYEEILEKSGLMAKYNKYFDNHEIKDGNALPEKTLSIINSLSKEVLSITEEEKNEIVNMDIKQCPEGKEYNVSTKRCIKKCKEGYTRNLKGRCTKGRTRKLRV